MAAEVRDDYFGDESWIQARKSIEFAREGVLHAVQTSILIDDGFETKVLMEPTYLIDGDDAFEIEDQPESEPDDPEMLAEVGLFWVDMGGLQAAIALTMDNVMRAAYLMGRLDQREHEAGSNKERFIKSRELGRVIAEQEIILGVPPSDEFEDKTNRILENSVKTHGSIKKALDKE